MLCEVLQRWRDAGAAVRFSNLGVLFHTSCVNYGVSDIQNLYRLAPLWFLPDDVYLELRLLLRSPQSHEAARLLLERGRRLPGWDMERFYAGQSAAASPPPFHAGPLLFLFGDLNKQDEFLRHMRVEPDWYILLCEEWSPKRCMEKTYPEVYPLSVCTRLAPVRQPVKLPPAVQSPEPHRLEFLSTLPAGGGVRIPGREFIKDPNKYGSYAYIYTCARFPDKVIKGYHSGASAGERLRKLQMLQSIGKMPLFGRLPLALPRELLYNGQLCVAYTMGKLRGQSLADMLNGNAPCLTDVNALESIIEQLFLLILELHTKHILINDLSFNNVVIDGENHVSLVDCDSFQVLWYPGGPITEYNRHPEVNPLTVDETLREPMHEYFALAVLLYQIFLRADNPLVRVNGGDNPNWNHAVFPLETDGYAKDTDGREMRVSAERWRYWMNQPRSLRRAFSDVFHFRRILSVGGWIRELGMNLGNT